MGHYWLQKKGNYPDLDFSLTENCFDPKNCEEGKYDKGRYISGDKFDPPPLDDPNDEGDYEQTGAVYKYDTAHDFIDDSSSKKYEYWILFKKDMSLDFLIEDKKNTRDIRLFLMLLMFLLS